MRRLSLLLVLGLALASGGCGAATEDTAPVAVPRPAQPTTIELDWREHYGEPNARLHFSVQRLEVTKQGWRARISFRNGTKTAFELARRPHRLTFGVLLLDSGELARLDELNKRGELPPPRAAARYEPALPLVVRPGESWRGTISAPGSLPEGSWVRVVFGAFVALGTPPAGMQSPVIWITDRTSRI